MQAIRNFILYLHLLFLRPSREPESQDEELPISEGSIYWGGVYLPESEAPQHWACIGSTGSGKTLNLRLLAQSVLPRVLPGSDTRAIVYDAKQDMLPLLHAIAPESRIVTVNAFDDRGAAWDISADVREPRVAIELVFTLMPAKNESQPFFTDAARHILYGVIISYILSGLEWTLADLLRGVASAKVLRRILKKHPQTRSIVSRYFGDKRLLKNILSTLASKLLPFEPIAAAWDDASEKVSLQQWSREEFILVLGNSEISRTAVDAINRCMFKRASDITLAQSESFTRRNWFFLDELSEAGPLPGLVSLLKKGRSKGACVVIVLQSVEGLRDSRLYGPHFAAEILGQIGHTFIGRLECPETAAWASTRIGDREVDQYTMSYTSSKQGTSSTRSQHVVTQRAVMASEFMDISPCTARRGMTGYYLGRETSCYLVTIPPEDLFDDALIPPDPNFPAYVERRVEAQYLRPWTDEEAIKFGAEQAPELDTRPEQKPRPQIDLFRDLDEFNG